MTTKISSPIEGYVTERPRAELNGTTVTIDCQGIYYKQVNEAVREAFEQGAEKVVLDDVNGQRYIGTGLKGNGQVVVNGTPGQDLGMFLDGPSIEVFGNAQDGVGNTMNAGRIVVHGSAGDVLGYGMRGGNVFIKGDVGYRVGIHMKAFESNRPIMVCGGKARDFFGEYMAGGLLILLGMESRIEGPMVGGYLGTGMHGGEIYVRGEVEAWQCGKEVGVFSAIDEDIESITPVLKEYCEAVGFDLAKVLDAEFTKLVPTSHRPYGKLYTYL